MRSAGRAGALVAALALPVLLALPWFAVPRLVECAFGCYSPVSAYLPPKPVGPDVAPGTFHATTGWGSLPWPVLASTVLAVLAGVLVALKPRWGRPAAAVGVVALVVVAVTSFVAQPGLDPQWPLFPAPSIPRAEVDAYRASLGPPPRLTDAMIDVRWAAYAGAAALGALVLACLAAAHGSARRPT